MYPSVGTGNTGSSGPRQAASSATVINPFFTSFCRWHDVTVEGAQSYSVIAQGGRGSNTSEILVFPLFYFFSLSLLFPSLFLFQT
jgi:hypothetical protein